MVDNTTPLPAHDAPKSPCLQGPAVRPPGEGFHHNHGCRRYPGPQKDACDHEDADYDLCRPVVSCPVPVSCGSCPVAGVANLYRTTLENFCYPSKKKPQLTTIPFAGSFAMSPALPSTRPTRTAAMSSHWSTRAVPRWTSRTYLPPPIGTCHREELDAKRRIGLLARPVVRSSTR